MSAHLYRSILEESADVICHVENGRFTYISPSAMRVFGWDPEALGGKDPLSLIYDDDHQIILDMLKQIDPDCVTSPTVRVRAICGDGVLKWCETTNRITADRSGGHRSVLVTRDISERKRLEDELQAIALQDGLTGLANRRAFDQALDLEWKRRLRSGGEMALLMLDVDCFNEFNDTYGHQAGDDCLRAVANCLRADGQGPENMACRYGGEELAVILAGTDADHALQWAEVLRSSIEALNILHGRSACASMVTVSIGVAVAVARSGETMRMPGSLLQAADHALYKAKNEGRNCVRSSVLVGPNDAILGEA